MAHEPLGYVIANDLDTSRAYMLVHQLKRIGTLALCVTTHKVLGLLLPRQLIYIYIVPLPPNSSLIAWWWVQGQAFPRIGDPSLAGSGEGHFDRVLCDVPCTGDGTVRKTFNIWRQWHPASGTYGYGLYHQYCSLTIITLPDNLVALTIVSPPLSRCEPSYPAVAHCSSGRDITQDRWDDGILHLLSEPCRG